MPNLLRRNRSFSPSSASAATPRIRIEETQDEHETIEQRPRLSPTNPRFEITDEDGEDAQNNTAEGEGGLGDEKLDALEKGESGNEHPHCYPGTNLGVPGGGESGMVHGGSGEEGMRRRGSRDTFRSSGRLSVARTEASAAS